MTRPAPTLLAALAMTACTAGDAHAGRVGGADLDTWGNRYPVECRDLSGVAVDHVVEVSRLPVIHNGGDRCGHWKRVADRSVIYVIETCFAADGSGAVIPRAEVLRHELCHEQLFRLTGDPQWHP